MNQNIPHGLLRGYLPEGDEREDNMRQKVWVLVRGGDQARFK